MENRQFTQFQQVTTYRTQYVDQGHFVCKQCVVPGVTRKLALAVDLIQQRDQFEAVELLCQLCEVLHISKDNAYRLMLCCYTLTCPLPGLRDVLRYQLTKQRV